MRWGLYILVFVFLIGFASAVVPDDCTSAAFWQMEGNADDLVGGHNGTGFPNEDVLRIGKATRFTGSQKITADNKGRLNPGGGFTIEMWMQKENAAQDGNLLEKDTYKLDYISDTPGSGHLKGTYGALTVSSPDGGIKINTPYHVALRYFITSGNLTIFVNGVPNGSAVSKAMVSPSNLPLTMGGGFIGRLDEVAFYDMALDDYVIRAHYTKSAAGKNYCHSEGAGGTSTTQSSFTIAGCTLPNGMGISAGSCYEQYYCGNVSLILYDTTGNNQNLPSKRGCSYEEASYVPGQKQCCPDEMVCTNDADGFEPVCQLNINSCNQTTEDDCDENNCYWLEIEQRCTNNPDEYSCSVYGSNHSCVEDIMNLGQKGLGTKICRDGYIVVDGSTFVVRYESCRCSWNFSADICRLEYDVVPGVYGGIPDEFTCSKVYNADACIDGSQFVNWTALTKITSGYDEALPVKVDLLKNVAVATGCINGSTTRSCGAPILKVPVVSPFSLIVSIVVLISIYAFKEKRKVRK